MGRWGATLGISMGVLFGSQVPGRYGILIAALVCAMVGLLVGHSLEEVWKEE